MRQLIDTKYLFFQMSLIFLHHSPDLMILFAHCGEEEKERCFMCGSLLGSGGMFEMLNRPHPTEVSEPFGDLDYTENVCTFLS